MIAKCNFCEIIWTDTRAITKIDPKSVPSQRCVDCVTFEYPLYTRRREEVEKSMGKPKKDVKIK